MVVALVAIVILGGIKSISKVCEKLVPVMAVFYVVCCLIIIGMNGQFLGEAIRQIIVGAFTPAGAAGGAVGSTITLALQFGFKRGIFSNESGLGSAPLVASSATTKNPARQALVSMTGTFWDTVVVCAITGLMLMTTLLANPELSTAIANGTISSGAGLATAAFEKIPVFGPLVLLIGLVTFAYSTILGWSQYGNRAISYLLGRKAVLPYYIVFLLFVFWGCIMVGDAAGSATVCPSPPAIPRCAPCACLFLSPCTSTRAPRPSAWACPPSSPAKRNTTCTTTTWRKSTRPRFRNTTRSRAVSHLRTC